MEVQGKTKEIKYKNIDRGLEHGDVFHLLSYFGGREIVNSTQYCRLNNGVLEIANIKNAKWDEGYDNVDDYLALIDSRYDTEIVFIKKYGSVSHE